MKIVIDEGRKNPSGIITHEVHVNNETYEVENLKKTGSCSWHSCKYYNECMNYKGGVVRRFDCVKNLKRITRIYNLITSFIIAELFLYLFYIKKLSFFKGVGILLIGIGLLDIICSIIEMIVPKIRDIYFCRKLRKKGKIKVAETEEEKEEVLEDKEMQEEIEKFHQSPYYQDVLKVENVLNNIREFSDKHTEISSDADSKIKQCIYKANDILIVLKKDILGNRIGIILFKNALEEFLYILKLYVKFLNDDGVYYDDSKEKIFMECVDQFWDYLSQQQIDSIIDNSSIDAQFINSTKIFKKMLDNKGDY